MDLVVAAFLINSSSDILTIELILLKEAGRSNEERSLPRNAA